MKVQVTLTPPKDIAQGITNDETAIEHQSPLTARLPHQSHEELDD